MTRKIFVKTLDIVYGDYFVLKEQRDTYTKILAFSFERKAPKKNQVN